MDISGLVPTTLIHTMLKSLSITHTRTTSEEAVGDHNVMGTGNFSCSVELRERS